VESTRSIQGGVSIIICCFNSSSELPATLSYLSSQDVPIGIPWEVIIVDNASTDNTTDVALASWPENHPAPLRIIKEPQAGLIYARYRGLAEAKYDYLSFIDDDNWVCPNWIQLVASIMRDRPEVGACGGLAEPQLDVIPPAWFAKVKGGYAVGPQGPEGGGDVTFTRGRLRGAGLTIRKSAWQQLIADGFSSLLVGHQGTTLTRGEDNELCFALVLAGWRLWYEPRLQLYHHLQSHRLNWKYLRRMRRGGGAATLGFDPYRFAIEETYKESKIHFWWSNGSAHMSRKHLHKWYFQACFVAMQLFKRPDKLLHALFFPTEGNFSDLGIESKLGRFVELIKKRKTYSTNICKIGCTRFSSSR
jgi:glycosyltransferase involved in cell wall biosynthesis